MRLNDERTRIANAPVSFGIFELSDQPPPLTADEMVDLLAEAGYTGIDLGPIGYLGTGQELTERLAIRGFLLAGGWIDLPYHDPDGFEAALPGLGDALEVFAAAPPADAPFAPRPTLACPGDQARFLRPAIAPGLPSADWPAFAEHIQEAVQHCRDAGFEPVFHQHLGTYVETPEEVERLLELTDVQLCVDTGHLALGGGDPVSCLRAWKDRIGSIHLKDADPDLFAKCQADGSDLREMMRRGVFSAIGEGAVDFDGVFAELRDMDYEGWLIVEQDTLPGTRTIEEIMRDQRANLERAVGS